MQLDFVTASSTLRMVPHHHREQLLQFEVAGMLLVLVLVLIVASSVLSRLTTFSHLLSPGLWAVTGKMGAGKTYLLTWCACLQMRRNKHRRACPPRSKFSVLAHKRPVYANYGVRGALPVTSWEEVMACPVGSLIVLDEAHLWWASDDYLVGQEREAWCSQLRKRRLTVIWTSQDYEFVSKRLRRLTFGVWVGTPALGGHRYRLYPSGAFSNYRSIMARPDASMWVRRRRRVMKAYDTLEIITPLDKVTPVARRLPDVVAVG